MFDFINKLREYLPKFQNVLELGSKKGDDLKLLDEYYEVVASEDEKVKTRYLKDEFIDIRVILVDKIKLDTHKKFDCIFSNQIFDKSSIEDIKNSFFNQKNILNKNGLIFHIFNKEDISDANIDELKKILNENYEILESKIENDVFYILAKVVS